MFGLYGLSQRRKRRLVREVGAVPEGNGVFPFQFFFGFFRFFFFFFSFAHFIVVEIKRSLYFTHVMVQIAKGVRFVSFFFCDSMFSFFLFLIAYDEATHKHK